MTSKRFDLSETERALALAWQAGVAFDAAESTSPNIGAEVLRRLITGTLADLVASPGRLVLRNAQVTDELDLSYLLPGSLPSGSLPALRFERCVFEKGVVLNKSTILSLTMFGCRVPQLSLMNCRIDGDLDLTGSAFGREERSGETAIRAEGLSVAGRITLRKIHDGDRFETFGPIRLVGARIGGNLEANGAHLRSGSSSKGCLILDGAEIDGSVFLQASTTMPFQALGGVRMPGATIKRDLVLTGAELNGTGRAALSCHRAHVHGAIRMTEDGPMGRPFRSQGALNLSNVVAETVEIAGARLEPDSTGLTLDLRRANVSGALRLKDLQRFQQATTPPSANGPMPRSSTGLALRPCDGSVEGRFDLSDASVGVLDDDPGTSWPARGLLSLDGFRYARISFGDAEIDKAASRLAWLDLQYSEPPGPDKFRPQPFEQLARVLREHGYSQHADTVAMRKRDWAIRCRTEKGVNSVLTRVMKVTSGHGYERRAAIGWVLGWWLGGIMLICAGELSSLISFHSADPAMAKSASIASLQPARGVQRARLDFHPEPETCDNLVEPLYALELMLPIVKLGQIDDCKMKASGPFPWIIVSLRALFQIVGVMLVTVLGVTLTGLLRKD